MKLAKLKTWAFKLKRQARLLQLIYNDPRTPLQAKILIWLTLGYLFSPIDLIPDFIPVLGIIDDIILVPLMITLIFKMIPKTVVEDNKIKAENEPLEKWKNNWVIILLVIVAWALCFVWIFKTFQKYWV